MHTCVHTQMGIELHIGGSLDFFLRRRQHPHHSVRCPLKIPKGGGGEGVEGPEGIRQEHSDQWAPEGSPRARLDIRPDQCQPRLGWGGSTRVGPVGKNAPGHPSSFCILLSQKSVCNKEVSLGISLPNSGPFAVHRPEQLSLGGYY